MAAPYGTGGGGFRFEDRVAAHYSAMILAEVSARGLIGEHPLTIASQRSQLGDPLDDIILTGRTANGETTKLSLQLKSNITLTKANDEWRDCVVRCWKTVFSDNFSSDFDRVGVALAVLPARYDAHYRPVLNWARYSKDGADFVARVNLKDFSNQTRAQFVADVREIIGGNIGRPPTDDEIWRLLRSLVILHFDFNAEASSADDVASVGVLQTYYSSSDRGRARDVWNALNVFSSQFIPAAGSAARQEILARLAQEGLPTGLQLSLSDDIARIRMESQRALAEIKFHIGNLHIHRLAAYEELTKQDAAGQFVQLISEPGAGKSALLREVAEQSGSEGPLFVMKNDRIHPRGWPAMATALGIKGDLESIISAFASSGNARLFIDGIDRITDPADQVTVNDILRAIASSETAASWSILVTVREQNLRHISTWLDETVLKQFGVRSVTIRPLTRDEKDVVAHCIPRLKRLLATDNALGILLSRPFFLNAFLNLSSPNTLTPASEAELLNLWWELGGSNDNQFASAQRRRDVLISLATIAIARPNEPLSIAGLEANAVDELRTAGVVRDSSLGHTVAFTHDIYEEWALTELLIRNSGDEAAFLANAGEPQTLTRALQLVATRMIEEDASGENWLNLLVSLDTNEMRPVWLRMATSAPLHSTRSIELLEKLRPELFQDDGTILHKLIRSLHTLEISPDLRLLEDGELEIDYEMRVKLAELSATPKGPVWVQFFIWVLPIVDELPGKVVPELVTALLTWQKAFGGYGIAYGRQIGELAYKWLRTAEEAFHPVKFGDRTHLFGSLGYDDEKKLEKSLRELLLSSAGDVPDLIIDYLKHHTEERRLLHQLRKEIVRHSIKLTQHTPTALVDFMIGAYVESGERKRARPFDDGFSLLGRGGFEDEFDFYPASPLHGPFLPLLRANEQEGLRLIHHITNYATKRLEAGYKSRGWTLIPLELKFPWGAQAFVGDQTVYTWYRGSGGANIVESALMALEQWSLEQLDGCADLSKLLERILQDSESVAMLGIAVSLILASDRKALPIALPFVMSQRLWNWDIARSIQDNGTHPNQIGNWQSDRVYLQAVRSLNQKPHRQREIRQLSGLFLTGNNEDQAMYREAWKEFEAALPFDIEEQRSDEEAVSNLQEKARMFAQQADLDNLGLMRGDDGNIYIVQTHAPYAEEPKHKEQIEDSVRLNAAMKLAMWAEKSRKSGLVDPALTIEAALTAAQDARDDGLFDYNEDEDFGESYYLTAGIAGTAYVATLHLPRDKLDGEMLDWCLKTLELAATVPERPNLGGRSSLSMMSPAVFAAYGYSALLSRNMEVERAKTGLLNLAADAMDEVAGSVCRSAVIYESNFPQFVHVLLNLLLRRCIFAGDSRPDHYSTAWSENEAESTLMLLDDAQHASTEDTFWQLPELPMTWLRNGPNDSKNIEDYARNEILFDCHLAEKTVLVLPISGLLLDPVTKASLLRLANDLLEYTSEEIEPPFKSEKGDFGSSPYEWIHAFSHWLGSLDVELLSQGSKSEFVSSVLKLPDEAALGILEGFMRVHLVKSVLEPAVIDHKPLAAWNEMTEWLLNHEEADAAFAGRYIDREYQSCAIMVLFCATVDLNSLVCGAQRDWKNMKVFETTVARAIAKFGNHSTLFYAISKLLRQGGTAFLPEPGLDWLKEIAVSNRSKGKFWESSGDNMLDILKDALNEHPVLSGKQVAIILFIADVLVDNGVRGAGFLQQELSKRL